MLPRQQLLKCNKLGQKVQHVPAFKKSGTATAFTAYDSDKPHQRHRSTWSKQEENEGSLTFLSLSLHTKENKECCSLKSLQDRGSHFPCIFINPDTFQKKKVLPIYLRVFKKKQIKMIQRIKINSTKRKDPHSNFSEVSNQCSHSWMWISIKTNNHF